MNLEPPTSGEQYLCLTKTVEPKQSLIPDNAKPFVVVRGADASEASRSRFKLIADAVRTEFDDSLLEPIDPEQWFHLYRSINDILLNQFDGMTFYQRLAAIVRDLVIVVVLVVLLKVATDYDSLILPIAFVSFLGMSWYTEANRVNRLHQELEQVVLENWKPQIEGQLDNITVEFCSIKHPFQLVCLPGYESYVTFRPRLQSRSSLAGCEEGLASAATLGSHGDFAQEISLGSEESDNAQTRIIRLEDILDAGSVSPPNSRTCFGRPLEYQNALSATRMPMETQLLLRHPKS